MSEKMQRFVDTKGQTPDKWEANARVQNFAEIYDSFIEPRAAQQASRCSQCGVPYCQTHCPLSNNIPDWLKMTAEGRLEEAYELSSATNNMPEVCGRICPQDRLCEGNCVIERAGHGTVTIGSIEKFITDNAFEQGWVKPIVVEKDLDQSIGIIGAGPAGLAAADQLRKLGYQITVYDQYDRAGGLMIYGIPGFKLEKHIVERRTSLLAAGGINFKLNFVVGRDATLAQLRHKHDAILIATGVYKAREVDIPGRQLKNIYPAMQFLTASNKKGLGDRVPMFDDGQLNAEGKDIVVIGGGDTAMDCVRTAIRQNAKSVKCLYRRDQKNMPGSAREVGNAIEEGVDFQWLTDPKEFVGSDHVQQVLVNKIQLGEPDATGRQRPEVIAGAETLMHTDMVITALGFDPEDIPSLFEEPKLSVSKWGTIKIDLRTMQTNLPGVFAAGDIVRGASLVVWAIRDGRDAAEAMDKYLQQKVSQKEHSENQNQELTIGL